MEATRPLVVSGDETTRRRIRRRHAGLHDHDAGNEFNGRVRWLQTDAEHAAAEGE